MAMTPSDDRITNDQASNDETASDVSPEPDESIDGYSLDDLSDYLLRGRTPRDAAIEASPECRLALNALESVHAAAWASLERDAVADPHRDDTWISGLLDSIRGEVSGGREIPVGHPDATVRLTVTEAAVQGLIRRVGDSTDGVILGSTRFDGDVTTPGAPVAVTVTAAARFGSNLDAVAERLRGLVGAALAEHTELTVESIDVVIDDIYAGGAS
ncbi:hypothetical protein [Marisediminicola sp. LYQ134]|uniref:hypothetical protein n=1 Tax=Marisediminicola sp. LYQ134 TaxID=3391061 RepID=UPI0039834394